MILHQIASWVLFLFPLEVEEAPAEREDSSHKYLHAPMHSAMQGHMISIQGIKSKRANFVGGKPRAWPHILHKHSQSMSLWSLVAQGEAQVLSF